jgi:NDP-sugar pyrophosphorylase family protein
MFLRIGCFLSQINLPTSGKRMQLIVPMANLASPFVSAGYRTPKPFLSVNGVPMVVRVVQDLPHADHHVFVVHPEHVKEHHAKAILREHFPGCSVVVAPSHCQGSACSVRQACEEIDLAEDVLVCAPDLTHLFDPAKFDRLAYDSGAEAIVWTYRNDVRVLRAPQCHIWIRTRPDQVEVVDISCTQPISEAPIRDQAATGTYWFASGAAMRRAIDQVIAANRRVRNELSMDVVPNLLLEASRLVLAFEVEKVIGWGTPGEYEDFLRWERYFCEHKRPLLRAA